MQKALYKTLFSKVKDTWQCYFSRGLISNPFLMVFCTLSLWNLFKKMSIPTVYSTCIELWEVDFTVVLILSQTPNPSLSLYFQRDKLIFGCVDANLSPPVISLICRPLRSLGINPSLNWAIGLQKGTVVRDQEDCSLCWGHFLDKQQSSKNIDRSIVQNFEVIISQIWERKCPRNRWCPSP